MLKATRSDQEFLELVRGHIHTEGKERIPIIHEKLTEHQYKDPTKSTEQDMYHAWRDVPPETACRVTFWGEVTLCHIEEGCIQASYLAANGGSLPGGLERIDKALSGGEDKDKEIDSCVRTILRRMSGLPEARGNRSVYTNCPLGRAWWREHITEEIRNTTGATRDDVLSVLRLSQQYWEQIVTLIVSRNSVLGDRNARDVLVWSLSERYKVNKGHQVFEYKNLEKLCRLLGTRCAWQELGVLEINELKEIIDQDISSLTSGIPV